MTILAIETSCDETSAAVLDVDKTSMRIISNIIASSLSLHAKSGGIIPETAARQQLKYMIPVLKNAMKNVSTKNIDCLAVTVGPGLIGSLLVGVETAKTLAFAWNKPIIGVNHLLGHFYANFIENYQKIELPSIALIVSGGHTDLLLVKSHKNIVFLGGTRDDAAGEAFDKIGRLLNLGYPGGPAIEKEAIKGNSEKFNLPRPMLYSKNVNQKPPSWDFSFSGLKTACLRNIDKLKKEGILEENITNIAASVQEAITDILVIKTLQAAIAFNVKSIIIGGGVCSNQALCKKFVSLIKDRFSFFSPSPKLCTDNAAMIAACAFFQHKPSPWADIKADESLYFK